MIDTLGATRDNYSRLVNILGKKYISHDISSPFDFITVANHGLNANVIKNFRTHFNFSIDTTAQLLNVSEPTLYRWTKDNKVLDSYLSVKLLELVELFLFGIGVFENERNFFSWFELPNRALGGMEPKKLAEFPNGISKVRELIGRIEHGVYS